MLESALNLDRTSSYTSCFAHLSYAFHSFWYCDLVRMPMYVIPYTLITEVYPIYD